MGTFLLGPDITLRLHLGESKMALEPPYAPCPRCVQDCGYHPKGITDTSENLNDIEAAALVNGKFKMASFAPRLALPISVGVDIRPRFVPDCGGEPRSASLVVTIDWSTFFRLSGGARMTPLLLALWLALDIHGDTTCPTPPEVSQHLARLTPEGGKGEQAPHAYLSPREGSVNIVLLGPDGGPLAERRLDRSGSCAEMAEAVAVILAAWQAKFSPTVSPADFQPALSAPTVVAPSPVSVPRRFLFDAGLALLTSVVGGELVLGAKLEGVLSPFAHGLGFHLALSMASNHTQTISSPPLEAQWIRPALSAGPNLRLHSDSLALDLHGDAVLAILHVKGSGLKDTASDTSVRFGLAAGLRGLWTWETGAAWVGADLLGFLGQDNLTVGNYGPVGRLPNLEIQVSLGIAPGRFH
jgi:hypothetical protein